VLIGGGSPKYLWILAREKQLPTAVIDHIIKLARERGYDTDALIFDAD
jgi:lipocalin